MMIIMIIMITVMRDHDRHDRRGRGDDDDPVVRLPRPPRRCFVSEPLTQIDSAAPEKRVEEQRRHLAAEATGIFN
jgi:hypothetical protein